MNSLYERIGGEAAVDAAVDLFYRKVLADKYVSRFFDTVDMEAQAAKQKGFLTMAFGGPNNYTGRDMRAAHQKMVEEMGLNDMHFDQILAHLRSTLAELGAPEAIIAEVDGIAASTRKDVMCR